MLMVAPMDVVESLYFTCYGHSWQYMLRLPAVAAVAAGFLVQFKTFKELIAFNFLHNGLSINSIARFNVTIIDIPPWFPIRPLKVQSSPVVDVGF